MAEMIALDQLPIEVQELLRRPAESDGYRSPVFKPLTDLRPQPFNRMHPRPTFVWSAPEPVNQPAYRHQPFPRLVFKPNGADVLDRTCRNVSEFQAAIAEGWQASYPDVAGPMSRHDGLKAELALMSDEDRAFLVEQQRAARLAKIQKALETASDTEIALLM